MLILLIVVVLQTVRLILNIAHFRGCRHASSVRRMLDVGVSFPFSPSAFQASLQTSPIQARNRTTGTAMSLIKKSDVKNHLSARRHKGKQPYRPVSQPDATGFSGVEPGRAESTTGHPIEDPLEQPSSDGPEILPIVIASSPNDGVAPAVSKSAQA